jgi:hypothetical protein
MRERSELMGGHISFVTPNAGGTVVKMSVPRANVESRERELREKELRENDAKAD